MSNGNPDPRQQLWTSFLAFLRHAVAAQRNGQAEARSIWLQAAAHLHALDDVAVATLVASLSGQGRHTDAVPRGAARTASTGRCRLQLPLRPLAATREPSHEAIAPYRHALVIDPDFPKLRNNLAAALKISGGDPVEELALLESAVDAHPGDSDAWTNLGQARRERLDLAGALDASTRAVELAPHDPLAVNNHALLLREAQRWDDAERAARTAHELDPHNPSYRSNLAMVHLVRGHYADGWREHEARWDGSAELRGSRPVLPGPQWAGRAAGWQDAAGLGRAGHGRPAAVLPIHSAAR